MYVFSLSLGLLAWVLGIRGIFGPHQPWVCWASFTACGLALLGQLFQICILVEQEDLSAVMDTIRAVSLAGTVLLAVTAGLHLAALWRKRP